MSRVRCVCRGGGTLKRFCLAESCQKQVSFFLQGVSHCETQPITTPLILGVCFDALNTCNLLCFLFKNPVLEENTCLISEHVLDPLWDASNKGDVWGAVLRVLLSARNIGNVLAIILSWVFRGADRCHILRLLLEVLSWAAGGIGSDAGAPGDSNASC